MTLQEVIEYCLSLEGSFKRYPFGSAPLVMSVKETKGFCDIYENQNPLHIVVKCNPEEAQFLRMIHECIKPGYHCNKEHWNSIYINGSIPDEEIKRMIFNSYKLVLGKKKETIPL